MQSLEEARDGDVELEELRGNLPGLEGVAHRDEELEEHDEDLGGPKDNEPALWASMEILEGNSMRSTKENSKRISRRNLKKLQTSVAVPAPASAWPARKFSVNRGFFKTMTQVHTNNSLQNSLA